MGKLEKETGFLERLREKYHVFNSLPDEVDTLHNPDGETTKPILLATVDDIAFAKQLLNKNIQGLCNTLDALHQLHDLARDLGAKGADYALNYIKENGVTK